MQPRGKRRVAIWWYSKSSKLNLSEYNMQLIKFVAKLSCQQSKKHRQEKKEENFKEIKIIEKKKLQTLVIVQYSVLETNTHNIPKKWMEDETI